MESSSSKNDWRRSKFLPIAAVKRIGVVLGDLHDVNVPALKFLILQMNSCQDTFEFEILACRRGDSFVSRFSGDAVLNRASMRADVADFLGRFHVLLEERIQTLRIKEAPPNYFVLVTLARFDDEFYSMRERELSVIALGNWKRVMAPPSILEFIITLLLREAVSSISNSLRGSIHLGTKGCLFDFTFHLEDARFKVLQGFVCNYCRRALQADGHSALADQLTGVLNKEWLGKSTDPGSPAGIVSNLGFDLFLTKGLKPTRWENFLSTIQQDGVRELLKLIGAVVLAGFIVWLGFQK